METCNNNTPVTKIERIRSSCRPVASLSVTWFRSQTELPAVCRQRSPRRSCSTRPRLWLRCRVSRLRCLRASAEAHSWQGSRRAGQPGQQGIPSGSIPRGPGCGWGRQRTRQASRGARRGAQRSPGLRQGSKVQPRHRMHLLWGQTCNVSLAFVLHALGLVIGMHSNKQSNIISHSSMAH